MAKNIVEVDGEIVNETEAAYLFQTADKEVWLPKSQCQWDADEKVMSISEWLAMREGLI